MDQQGSVIYVVEEKGKKDQIVVEPRNSSVKFHMCSFVSECGCAKLTMYPRGSSKHDIIPPLSL